MRLKPKKRLGQNFLIDSNIREKIIEHCKLCPDDFVLEIGSGRGEITGLIAERAAKVLAVEIDRDLCEVSEDNLKSLSNAEVVNQDILKLDFTKYLEKSKKIKVIGNIPYYITTPIIERLLELKDLIESIFITVQKEFALRAAAQAGSKDYGSLSCFLQYYTSPKILFTIKKTCFSPVPKVDSCLLELKIREKPPVETGDEDLFFNIIRAAFNKRRKTLRNSLKEIIPQNKLELFFEKYKINRKVRAEELTLFDFANLTKTLYLPITEEVKKDKKKVDKIKF